MAPAKNLSKPPTDAASEIRLFLSDIDGCLSEPFVPYDLGALAEVRAAIHAPDAVPFALLTGRPFGYAEAFSQLLALDAPAFFEAGTGAFLRREARVVWHPALTREVEAAMAEVRAWVFATLLPSMPTLAFDYGKRVQAGVLSPDGALVEAAAEQARAFVDWLGAPLVVFTTPVSMDVVPAALTKGAALGWIGEMTGVSMEAMAFIGDSEGDALALAAVGRAFAPANAAPGIRAMPGVAVTTSALTAGVLEAYAACRATG